MTAHYPDWATFTPEKAAAELPRLLDASERAVAALEASSPQSYEAFVWPLDEATRALWRLWGDVSHMLGVMNDAAWRKLEDEWQGRIVAFALRVSQSPALYRTARALVGAERDATRRRILEKMVRDAELSGVALEGAKKDRFNAIQAELAKLASDFHNAVIDATTPEIADAAYVEAMKHEKDRAKRERLYRARVLRAPENAARIVEILRLRREMADLLGYADYAALSLVSKCAPSVTAVLDMIDRLDAATVERARDERKELGDGDVQPWDVAYEAERLRERKFAYSEDELKRYFPLEKTLQGLFRMAHFLFGVEIVERKGAERPAVWHEDVRFFEVREKGMRIAEFYFDPFVRTGLKSGGAWMNEFRNRRGHDVTPLAVVVTNFPLPDAQGNCLLPLREVETLFHEFGHALQCMLTRVEEEDAAGINLVEWDAVEVASQFMENWCLDDHTGIEVPAELKAKVRAARNFRAASACRRQLAFAQLDMRLHATPHDATPPDPVELQRATFAHFGLPTISEDRFLCAFTHIFAGGYAAGYYGYKWAEVMSADCYGAFEEAGLGDDAALQRVGAHYRETILALGGSVSALEAFRRFRGREPDIRALLRQQDLL